MSEPTPGVPTSPCFVWESPNYHRQLRICYIPGHTHKGEKWHRVILNRANFEALTSEEDGPQSPEDWARQLEVIFRFQGKVLTRGEQDLWEQPATRPTSDTSASSGSRSRRKTGRGRRSSSPKAGFRWGSGRKCFTSPTPKSKSTPKPSESSPRPAFVPPATRTPNSSSGSLSFVERLQKKRQERATADEETS